MSCGPEANLLTQRYLFLGCHPFPFTAFLYFDKPIVGHPPFVNFKISEAHRAAGLELVRWGASLLTFLFYWNTSGRKRNKKKKVPSPGFFSQSKPTLDWDPGPNPPPKSLLHQYHRPPCFHIPAFYFDLLLVTFKTNCSSVRGYWSTPYFLPHMTILARKCM